MVKPSSQEGLKLTINKTGSGKRESKGVATSSSSSSASSKKQHTGLKPGVNSGPASKKALSSASGTGLSSSSKHIFQKANSSGNLSSKLGGSSTSGGGLPLTKSNSTNSFQEHSVPRRRPSMCSPGNTSGGGVQRKSSLTASGSASGSGSGPGLGAGRMSPAALTGSMSQPPPRFDHHTDMMTILQYASPTMAASMEGFIKRLHNRFQIPKLSQRPSGSSVAAGHTAEQASATAASFSSIASTSSSQEQEQQQLNADLSALASSLTATPCSSSGTQKPSTAPSPATSRMLLNLSSSGTVSAVGDGIDEELLASLAGK
ncbi:uncharacterized protein Dvir_GJ26585 [Drosophila virilis]|uniref:Uncharacterized protein n=2 Tax=Drosophila virilis TaxID=7244 RepID=A0A0Q9WK72_DROVI|nr:uncharacterized protein Dvir_GJ26585 [Drosophila virilis]